jgi:hypothetical protein
LIPSLVKVGWLSANLLSLALPASLNQLADSLKDFTGSAMARLAVEGFDGVLAFSSQKRR